jgi:hypothetical protein
MTQSEHPDCHARATPLARWINVTKMVFLFLPDHRLLNEKIMKTYHMVALSMLAGALALVLSPIANLQAAELQVSTNGDISPRNMSTGNSLTITVSSAFICCRIPRMTPDLA